MTQKQVKEFYKIETPKVKIEVNKYWLVDVEDYHEFGHLEIFYKKTGIDVKYEELGYDRNYIAIFWIGERPSEYIEGYKKINEFE